MEDSVKVSKFWMGVIQSEINRRDLLTGVPIKTRLLDLEVNAAAEEVCLLEMQTMPSRKNRWMLEVLFVIFLNVFFYFFNVKGFCIL